MDGFYLTGAMATASESLAWEVEVEERNLKLRTGLGSSLRSFCVCTIKCPLRQMVRKSLLRGRAADAMLARSMVILTNPNCAWMYSSMTPARRRRTACPSLEYIH